jgi:hypothetical protein
VRMVRRLGDHEAAGPWVTFRLSPDDEIDVLACRVGPNLDMQGLSDSELRFLIERARARQREGSGS